MKPLRVMWHMRYGDSKEVFEHLNVIEQVLFGRCWYVAVDNNFGMINRLKASGVLPQNQPLVTRAGNLRSVLPSLHKIDGAVTCKKVGRSKQPVVLPDGSCQVCCNAYDLSLPVGNLVQSTWSELDFDSITARQASGAEICNNGCHLARRA